MKEIWKKDNYEKYYTDRTCTQGQRCGKTVIKANIGRKICMKNRV